MGGRFEVIDRPVGRDDGAFFAGHTPVLLALRAGRMFWGFVGVATKASAVRRAEIAIAMACAVRSICWKVMA